MTVNPHTTNNLDGSKYTVVTLGDWPEMIGGSAAGKRIPIPEHLNFAKVYASVAPWSEEDETVDTTYCRITATCRAVRPSDVNPYLWWVLRVCGEWPPLDTPFDTLELRRSVWVHEGMGDDLDWSRFFTDSELRAMDHWTMGRDVKLNSESINPWVLEPEGEA